MENVACGSLTPALGARDLGGIAGEEVIHRLFRRQSRNRRQHAESIGGQEDNVLGMSAHARESRVLDEIHRVGRARVLGHAVIVVIRNACVGIKHNIFQDTTEADRMEDLGLIPLRQPDALGVAAALEVEDAIGAPAVLVVADKPPRGIGRKGGLAGARESEE